MTLPHSPHFSHKLRVYWEDTDAGGVVFYANYLKFFERARTEWLRSLGFSQENLRVQQRLMFVVAETQIRYLRPAKLDDWLTINVQSVAIGRASMTIAQTACRDSQLLIEGDIRIGCVDPSSFRPRRIPTEILQTIE